MRLSLVVVTEAKNLISLYKKFDFLKPVESPCFRFMRRNEGLAFASLFRPEVYILENIFGIILDPEQINE